MHSKQDMRPEPPATQRDDCANSETKSLSSASDDATVHTIYCFNNGGSPGWYQAMALADDGHLLAQHICSDVYFMRHDLGITSNWKHDDYNAHFGPGKWRLEWVDDVLTHDGLQAAYALNQKLPREG